MHPKYEHLNVPASERVQFLARVPKELAAQIKVLAQLEDDTAQNLAAEAFARLIEARKAEPIVGKLAIQARINELGEELSILQKISDDLPVDSQAQ